MTRPRLGDAGYSSMKNRLKIDDCAARAKKRHGKIAVPFNADISLN
jgi:hypothetical protein